MYPEPGLLITTDDTVLPIVTTISKVSPVPDPNSVATFVCGPVMYPNPPGIIDGPINGSISITDPITVDVISKVSPDPEPFKTGTPEAVTG